MKERRKDGWKRKGNKENEALILTRTSLGKLICEIYCSSIPTQTISAIMAFNPKFDLLISEILACARAILKDSFTGTRLAAAAAQLPGCQEKETTAPRRYYICLGPNHMARGCLRWCESPRPRKFLTGYWCKWQGHIAQNCSGNEQEDESSAPVSSPNLIWMAHCLRSLCRLTE